MKSYLYIKSCIGIDTQTANIDDSIAILHHPCWSWGQHVSSPLTGLLSRKPCSIKHGVAWHVEMQGCRDIRGKHHIVR